MRTSVGMYMKETGDEEFGVGMVLRREINMFSGQTKVDFAKWREIAMVKA